MAGASVSSIALEAGINANLLFAWRRQLLRSMAESMWSDWTLPEGRHSGIALARVAALVDADILGLAHPAAQSDY